jgi:hypothetical protein
MEFHSPLAGTDRKELAKNAEMQVRTGHVRALAGLV